MFGLIPKIASNCGWLAKNLAEVEAVLRSLLGEFESPVIKGVAILVASRMRSDAIPLPVE